MESNIDNCQKKEDLREKNFSAFESRYGIRPRIDGKESDKYRMDISRSGEPVLYIRNVDGLEELRLNSQYNPSYEASRWAEKQEIINRRTTIALLGFSTGVFLAALMNKLRPDTTFYIYEPEEGLFSFVCAYLDLTGVIKNPKIRLYVTEDQRNRMDNDMLWELSTYRPEAKGIETPFYAGSAGFDKICVALERYASSMRSFQRVHGRRTLSCRLYAWNHMQDSASIVELEKRLPKDIPVVIVAAGPSLHKNVEQLNRLKGHALIICVDRAVALLDKYGIIPDLVTSIDADKDSDFLDVEVVKNVPILCTYQLNDITQKKFRGRCIYYYGLKQEKELLGDKSDNGNGFDHGGNVAGSAFSLCRVIGIKTIILIGQDLAYLGEQTHAVGTDEEIENIEDMEVEGIDGNPIKSNLMWVKFRDFYERQITLFPDLRVIDATEGGAMIHGTEIMTLAEVAEKICDRKFDIDEIFDNLPRVQTREDYVLMLEKLFSWIKEIDKLAEAANNLAEVCRQLLKISKYQDITDPKYEKKLKRMDELRKQIYSSPVNAIIEDYWIEDIYTIPDRTFMLRSNEEAIPVFDEAIKYYEKLPDECKGLKEEMLNRIGEGKRDYGIE